MWGRTSWTHSAVHEGFHLRDLDPKLNKLVLKLRDDIGMISDHGNLFSELVGLLVVISKELICRGDQAVMGGNLLSVFGHCVGLASLVLFKLPYALCDLWMVFLFTITVGMTISTTIGTFTSCGKS